MGPEPGGGAAAPPDFGGKIFNRVRPLPPDFGGFCIEIFNSIIKLLELRELESFEEKISNFR